MINKFRSASLKNKNWLFIICLLLFCWFYGVLGIIDRRPYSIHQWRQADCLSLALHYYKDDMRFFMPAQNFLGDNDGKAVSECPFVYYIVAILWKCFGYHEWFFRVITLSILFLGLFNLFKLTEDLLKDTTWAILLTLFLYTSPVLIFYSSNFLPDAQALCLTLVGWNYFRKFYRSSQNKHLFISMLFFTLAALLKVTTAINVVVIGAIFLIDFFKAYLSKDHNKLFKRPVAQLLFLSIPVVFSIAWYSFATYYNKKYMSAIFLVNPKPFWELDHDALTNTFNRFREDIFPQFFNKYGTFVLLVLYAITLVFYKKANKLLLLITTFLLIGCLCYISLFFQLLNVHDYYMNTSLILVPAILLSVFMLFKNSNLNYFKSTGAKVVFGLVLVFLAGYARANFRVRYYTAPEGALFLTKKQIGFWSYHHWDYSVHNKALEKVTPYLRQLGINRNDKVVSWIDVSPNISLYLMDQKGWTSYGGAGESKEALDRYIKKGAKYLIINNDEVYKQDFIQPYLKDKIGSYRNIDIFDLRYL